MKVANALTLADTLPQIANRSEQLSWLRDGLDAKSLLWISGYAAGLAAAQENTPPIAVEAPIQTPILSIFYGSQTGNARRAAEKLLEQVQFAGISARLIRLDQITPKDLLTERAVWFVVSTQGEGDPSDDARRFVEVLISKRAPPLPDLRYAVFGLGDSSYPKFCEIARLFDERLAELGATRWFARGESDVDVDASLLPWSELAVKRVRAEWAVPQSAANVTPLRARSMAPVYHRDTPFSAEVLANQRITARDSIKDIRHIELSLEHSGLNYEPGDSLGVWPENRLSTVEAVLTASALDGDASVAMKGESRSLSDWLRHERDLGKLSRSMLVALAERSVDPQWKQLLQPEQRPALSAFLQAHRVLDVLSQHRVPWDAESLLRALNPLTPRLYSIASSRKQVDDEVHLTVAHAYWQNKGIEHHGVASHWLATCSSDEARARVYVEPNQHFRLPANADTDIIMIGPGTGVAPFRAFTQERAAIGAKGRNWLFFGNPHFASDFLYQTEWQQALKRGQLARMDLAFSRDQAEKIYVQHRLREQSRELYAWLQSGAHLYVCGDATHMAGDVHQALLDAIAKERQRGAEDALTYLSELDSEHRYLRDVYS